jgi:hypothetical protein
LVGLIADWPRAAQLAYAMALFSLRVQCPARSADSDPFEIAGNEAWGELTKACADLIGAASRGIELNSEWKMELRDEAQQPIFRIRLVAETL